jgi:hypothetical protein
MKGGTGELTEGERNDDVVAVLSSRRGHKGRRVTGCSGALMREGERGKKWGGERR